MEVSFQINLMLKSVQALATYDYNPSKCFLLILKKFK